MDKKTYRHRMSRALVMMDENPEYWSGYRRGLRKRFYGKSQGKVAKHNRRLLFDGDDRGQGYRDGYTLKAIP